MLFSLTSTYLVNSNSTSYVSFLFRLRVTLEAIFYLLARETLS